MRAFLFCCALLCAACGADRRTLPEAIDRILTGRDAVVGVAVVTPEGDLIVRNDSPLPTASVFKFPAAVAVLRHLEAHGIPLSHRIAIPPERLDTATYSPLRDSLPPSGGALTLRELLRHSVSLSDNIACDLLLDFIGGPAAADSCIRALGIDGIRIDADERTMHLAPESRAFNRARPSAVCTLFARLLRGELLDAEHTAFLSHLLETAATGSYKLRAGLPRGTRLGHKTGHSDRTADGVRIAENDAGYVRLPDGRTCCIAVFVCESRESDAVNAAIAAEISAATYDYFTDQLWTILRK